MTKVVQQIKGYNKNVLTWEQLLRSYNHCVKVGIPGECRPPGYLVAKPRVIEDLNIPEFKEVVDDLQVVEAHMYISLVEGSIGYGMHDDIVDVWFWQCQGMTYWTIDEMVYTMEPGDLLFIPRGTMHSVESAGPRAGMSMSRTVTADLTPEEFAAASDF